MKTSLSSLTAAATLALSSCAAPGWSVVIDTCAHPYHRHHHRSRHIHVTPVVRQEVVQRVVNLTPPTPTVQISNEQLAIFETLLLKEAARRELAQKELENRLKWW